jgi:hypothetical protein
VLRNDKLLFCRERSPVPVVLRTEAGVRTSAKCLDRIIGLLNIGHRFGLVVTVILALIGARLYPKIVT